MKKLLLFFFVSFFLLLSLSYVKGEDDDDDVSNDDLDFGSKDNISFLDDQNGGSPSRVLSVKNFGKKVKKAYLSNFAKKDRKEIKKILKEIQKEVSKRRPRARKLISVFGRLVRTVEKATNKKGEHLVTVLRLKQKNTLNKLLDLLQISRSGQVQRKARKLTKLVKTVKSDYHSYDKVIQKLISGMTNSVNSFLVDLTGIIYSLKLPVTPKWKKKLLSGKKVLIQELKSASSVLSKHSNKIGKILSEASIVVTGSDGSKTEYKVIGALPPLKKPKALEDLADFGDEPEDQDEAEENDEESSD